jgi:hypothetical protein
MLHFQMQMSPFKLYASPSELPTYPTELQTLPTEQTVSCSEPQAHHMSYILDVTL